MALIQCTKCKNEYDNYDSKCPYCGMASPMLTNAKPVLLRFVVIALVVGAVFVALSGSLPVKQWMEQLTAFSQGEGARQPQPSPEASRQSAAREAAQREVEAMQENPLNHAVPASDVIMGVFGSDTQLLTSIESVDFYTARLVQLLERENSSIRIKTAPIESTKNNFTYTISDKTTLVLEFDRQNQNLRSVTLNDTQERDFVKRTGDARGSFFVAALSQDMDVQDMNAQLDYLLQLIKASRKNDATYSFENHQLSAYLDRNKGFISIKLTM